MNNELLITFEILLVIDIPLIILYLKGNWPVRTTIMCLMSIPVLWYLTYSPLHELSHVAGTYLVGGKVIYVKLIPRFWLAEFGHAWIIPEGLRESWQQLIMTLSPYILDVACIATGIFLLRRDFSKNPFILGFIFMLLCLRPAFDFVCETIAFLSGNFGDICQIERTIGVLMTWSFIGISLCLSVISIFIILRRFIGFPEDLTKRSGLPATS